MKKVLWLASWYPNDADPFTGDFIQRHARATAAFQPIELVFIGRKADPPVHFPGQPEAVAGLSENRLYYNADTQPGMARRLRSARLYLQCFLSWFGRYRSNNGLPQLVHVHVAMRAGLIALFLKKRFGIPFVLTEHWTGYFDDSAHPISENGPLYRFFLKKILRNATLILPVSADLGRRMIGFAGPLPVTVIPNVVDTRYFFPGSSRQPIFRFVHVSSMTAIKNTAGILRAFSALIESGGTAELVMVGPAGNRDLTDLPHRDKISFTGEIPYLQVAGELKKANAFVLFSNRENQPCVILESLCCGVPVIATRTGGIPEVINESNGLLVDVGDEAALLGAMKKMLSGYAAYDSAAISRGAARLFSYEAIGEGYLNCYNKLFPGA